MNKNILLIAFLAIASMLVSQGSYGFEGSLKWVKIEGFKNVKAKAYALETFDGFAFRTSDIKERTLTRKIKDLFGKEKMELTSGEVIETADLEMAMIRTKSVKKKKSKYRSPHERSPHE